MICPRCGGYLTEHEPDARWCRYWQCDWCMRAYRLERSTLVIGRKPAQSSAEDDVSYE